MGYDKAKIIAGVLNTQADEIDVELKLAAKSASAHEGARDILKVFAANIPWIMPQAEKDIEKDEVLQGDAKTQALKHVGVTMARIATVIQEMAKNQNNLVLGTNAQYTVLLKQANKFRKKAHLVVVEAERKKEIEEEQDVKPGDMEKIVKKRVKAKAVPKKKAKKNGALKEARL